MESDGGVSGADEPFQCFRQSVRVALDLEDLDRFIRGTGCESPAVVVEHCIMLAL